MEKKYDEIEEQPSMASEPLADYGVMNATKRRVHSRSANLAMDMETMSVDESRELHEFASKMRVEYARCEAQGLSNEQTIEALKERLGLIDLEDARKTLLNTVREIYAQP